MVQYVGEKKIVIGPSDALGIIDPNSGFVDPGGNLLVNGIPGEVASNDVVIDHIIGLNRKPFAFKFASMDKHSKNSIEHTLFPDAEEHCVEGTADQECTERLKFVLESKEMNMVLIKGTNDDVYAFSISTSLDFYELLGRLRKAGITRIIIVGWAYDFCIGLSAIALAGQGFEVILVRDCTRSVQVFTSSLMDAKLALENGITIVDMADIA